MDSWFVFAIGTLCGFLLLCSYILLTSRHNAERGIREHLAGIEAALRGLIAQGEKLMAAIDDIQAAVTAENTVIDSAITLINGLSAALAAAGTDPVKLAALQTDI